MLYFSTDGKTKIISSKESVACFIGSFLYTSSISSGEAYEKWIQFLLLKKQYNTIQMTYL